jgi:hypothetical protein
VSLHHAIKSHWSESIAPPSALDGGERPASRPSRFIPRERDPGGGWVGPRAGLDAVN